MSESCCNVPNPPKDAAQKMAIYVVLGINMLFFFGEGIAGILANSSALMADAVDMGGDAFVYFLSLLALGKGLAIKSKVAIFNSSFELVLGVGVLIEVSSKLFREVQPVSVTMLTVGSLALIANLVSGWILLSHREKDINMKAVWICTRNDIFNNFFTLVAGGLVYLYGSKWPDIVAGFLIAGLIVFFSAKILREGLVQLKASRALNP